jgi:phosphate transport system permease protein
MTINALAALQSVPDTLIEAGLSLGLRPSRVMMRIILPAARARVFTGIFLAFSRAVGETAPILFVIGASSLPIYKPDAEATTLPTMMWAFLNSSYPSQREECWGIALVLMVAVLFFNVISRVFLARTQKS